MRALHRAALALADATSDSGLPFTWRILTPETAPQAGLAPLSDPPLRELAADIAQACQALEGQEWRQARQRLRILQAAARRALHAAEQAGDASGFHALATALAPWWIELGAHEEGLYWFGRVGTHSLSLEGRALRDAAWGALHLAAHEHAAAEPLLIEAVTILCATQPGSRALALSLNQRGRLYQDMGRYKEAARDHVEASAIWERLDDRHGLLRSINNQAVVTHDSGDLKAAGALQMRAARIAADLGDARAAGVALSNLAVLHASTGDLAKAQTLTEAVLQVWRRLGIVELQVVALNNLARFASARGEAESAGRYDAEAALMREQVAPQAGLALEPNAVLSLGALGFLPVCDLAEQMFE